MTGLFWNVLLATCWVLLTGNFALANYGFGLMIAYLVIALIHRRVPALRGYPYVVPRFLGFMGFFIWELLLSNIRIAIDILTPAWRMKPGVLAYPMAARSELEITLVANFISLTPGTLVLDVSEDRRTLFIHAMFLADRAQALADLNAIEQRLLRVMR